MSDRAVRSTHYTYMINDSHTLFKVYPNFEQHAWDYQVDVPDDVLAINTDVFKGKKVQSICLPNDMTEIDRQSFELCTNLFDVHFPDYLETIGPHAFRNCTKLEISLDFPQILQTIGGDAFNKSGIKNIYNLGNVSVIQSQTFMNCPNLTTAGLRNSPITSIGLGAFYGCKKLNRVGLPETLEHIGGSAFANCSDLYWIQIPAKVDSIATRAFENCTRLTEVEFMSDDQMKILYRVNDIFGGCNSLHRLEFPSKAFVKEDDGKWHAYARKEADEKKWETIFN